MAGMDLYIKMVFGDLNKNAKTCLTLSGHVGTLKQNLLSKADALEGGGFIGHTAQAWFGEVKNEVIPRLDKLQTALADSAEVIQWISEHYDAGANQYASLFKKLTHG